jgi:hypothetical protein
MVPKHFASFINEHYEADKTVGFDDQLSKAAGNRGPVLAKLHGSADSGVIVPPTWAKGTHRRIAPTWKKAFEVLENSNQIRFIGYSAGGR